MERPAQLSILEAAAWITLRTLAVIGARWSVLGITYEWAKRKTAGAWCGPEPEQARDDLMSALRSGEITAFVGSKRTKPGFWLAARMVGASDQQGLEIEMEDGRRVCVRLSRDDVMRVWPRVDRPFSAPKHTPEGFCTAPQALAMIAFGSFDADEWWHVTPEERDERWACAETKLRDALSAGEFSATGRRGSYAARQPVSLDPEKIPAIIFLSTNRVFTPSNWLTLNAGAMPMHDYALWREHEAPDWCCLCFPKADVMKLAPPRRAERPNPAADRWMINHVTTRGLWKRDAAIRACMKETSCRWLEAEAAWQALPEDLRRRRGRPPKNERNATPS